MQEQKHKGMGISGRIAAFFQGAQITPLLALVAFLLGAFAVLAIMLSLLVFIGESARDAFDPRK